MNTLTRWGAYLLVAGFLVGGLIGIGAVSRAQGEGIAFKTVSAPLITMPGQSGGTLTTAAREALKGFNPLVDDGEVTQLTQATLIELNPLTLEFEPAVAESFSISPDNTSLSFTIRPGLRWSDGTPFTLADVEFSLSLFQDEEILSSLAERGNEITPPPFDLERDGKRTLNVALGVPVADQLLGAFADDIPMLPKHKLGKTVRSLNPDADRDDFAEAWPLDVNPDEVVGLGPYRLRSVTKTGIPFLTERIQSVVIERNPNYWKRDEAGTRLPYVDEVTVLLLEDDDEIATLFREGELDLMPLDSAEEAANLADRSPGTLAVGGQELGADFLTFNQDIDDPELRRLFRDRRFRRAVAMAIDRNAALQETPEQARFFAARESFVHPLSPFRDDESTVTYPVDLDGADALLDEIGLKDGNGDGIREFANGDPVALELITNEGNEIRVGAAALFESRLRQIGIALTARPIPFEALIDRLDLDNKRVDYEAILVRFGLGATPLSPDYLQCQFSSEGNCHIHRFSDASAEDLPEHQRRIDEIFEAIQQPGLKAAEREPLLRELQSIISHELPFIPLWSPKIIAAFQADLRNTQAFGFTGLTDVIELLWRQ